MHDRIHPLAATGFAAAADAYTAGRPDYPSVLDAWLVEQVGLAPGKVVVDLATGTGKFIPRLASTGARVIALEPVAAMRAAAARAHPSTAIVDGRATAMPLDDASVDAVVCAQAFHWFATADALAEIHRVLKPGGVLALVWNVRDESVPWVHRITELLAPYEADAPRYASGAWREAFPAIGFGPLEEWRFPHVHRGPAARVIVDRFLSVSFIAALPPDERAHVAALLQELADTEPALAGRGEIDFPYDAFAYRCVRLA